MSNLLRTIIVDDGTEQTREERRKRLENFELKPTDVVIDLTFDTDDDEPRNNKNW